VISLSIDDRQVQAGLRTLIERSSNPARAMVAISKRMLESTEMNFRQQGRPKWKSMAASTAAMGGAGRKLLQKSGAMAASIQMGSSSTEAWVGTNKPYAAFQQFGTKAHTIKAKNKKVLAFGGKFAKQVNHPGLAPRPFLALTEGDKSDILSIIGAHLSQL
jgi:phage virion morphogenesis protein